MSDGDSTTSGASGARKWLLLLIVVLVATNTATVTAWLSFASLRSVPNAVRDGGVAFGAVLALGTGLLATLKLL